MSPIYKNRDFFYGVTYQNLCEKDNEINSQSWEDVSQKCVVGQGVFIFVLGPDVFIILYQSDSACIVVCWTLLWYVLWYCGIVLWWYVSWYCIVVLWYRGIMVLLLWWYVSEQQTIQIPRHILQTPLPYQFIIWVDANAKCSPFPPNWSWLHFSYEH